MNAATVKRLEEIRHKLERSIGTDLDEAMETYFTVQIPFSKKPTKWHPTDSSGPFSILTRGAFKSEKAASAWADEHLDGQPYTVKKVS